jgi:hypothetical protein
MKKQLRLLLACLAVVLLAACSDDSQSTKLAKGVDEAYVGTYTLKSMGQANGNQLNDYRDVPLSEDLSYGETIQLKKDGTYVYTIDFYDDLTNQKLYQSIIQTYTYTNDGKQINKSDKPNTYHIKAYKHKDGSLMMNYDGLKQLQDNGGVLAESTEKYDLYDASKWYETNETAAKTKQKLFFTDEGHLMSVTYSKADSTTSVLVYEKEVAK